MEQKLTQVRPKIHTPIRLRVSSIVLLCATTLVLIPFILFVFSIDHSSHTGNTAVLNALKINRLLSMSLLPWLVFFIVILSTLIATMHYKLHREPTVLLLAYSLFVIACMGLVQLQLSNPLFQAPSDHQIALNWTLDKMLFALLLMVGTAYILGTHNITKARLYSTAIFVITSLCIIYGLFNGYFSSTTILPQVQYTDVFLKRPYDFIPLILFSILLTYLLPSYYRKSPSIFSQILFIIVLIEIMAECCMIFASQQPHDKAFNLAHLLTLSGYILFFLSLIMDFFYSYKNTISMLEDNELKLQQLAMYDPLTNLINRVAFENSLDAVLANAARHKQSFALLFVDLDNFKLINDSMGHDAGDQLLKQVAHRLCKSTRRGDLSSRLGGDEFGIILPYIDNPNSAGLVAKKLIKEVNEAYYIHNKRVYSGASVGIAIYPSGGEDYHSLLKNADIAMYRAKSMGRNTYEYYTPKLSEQHFRQLEIESHLRDALTNDEFHLVFQPKYHLKTQRIIGAETLIRWNSTELGFVSPVEFIEMAEKTGLIIDIGQWVLRNACLQFSKWIEQYSIDYSFSVNLSPVQLSHRDFIQQLKLILNQADFTPNTLDLEVTETSIMESHLDIASVLSDINELGVTLSLDDFGTGYSSLSRISSLPIQTLKIDRSFVTDIETNKDDATIVDTIIQLANSLGLYVIAEGIETQTQLDYLIQRGCSCGQGYLMSKPVDSKAFEVLIQQDIQKDIL